MATRRAFLAGASTATLAFALPAKATELKPALEIDTPMPAPDWAVLQRELLRANAVACETFYDKYFDDRGYLEIYERWGANDGPDDAIENVNNWPLLHAIGGAERIKTLYTKAWEAHLRQFTAARTTQVEFGRDGMYYREFPAMLDWQHHAEFLTMFNVQGLSDPDSQAFQARARRYAGFYMGTDPGAPNYDPKVRIIRSAFNGSRGPLLRPATAQEWAGDPFEVDHRFDLGHGERTYEETLAHYRDYGQVVGDHPLNLLSTTLAFNAYMVDHEPKYRDWLLSYVDAWTERARANNNVLPSNIGLDGTIGGAADGHWWGGVYGWGFSPVVPQTGEREDRNRVPRAILAFMNAYVLTGDDKYLDVWRKQTDTINAQRKTIDGKPSTPRMYGPDGWYSYAPGDYMPNVLEIWYMSMKPADRARAGKAIEHPWIAFLDGRNPGYPGDAMRKELAKIQAAAARQRADTSTPDTRLADNPMDKNPAAVTALIQLTMGGLHIGRPGWAQTSPSVGGAPLYARLRYFDPVARRAGLPEDVAALVDTLTADETAVTLVNLDPVKPRTVTIQGGAYGEHSFRTVSAGGKTQALDGSSFTLRLSPGAGARLVLATRRFVNQPTLRFPWNR
jgi:hypothetical protein